MTPAHMTNGTYSSPALKTKGQGDGEALALLTASAEGEIGSRSEATSPVNLFVLLTVIDDLDFEVLAPRAFKRAPIVTEFLRLNANEPHVCVTQIAARVRDHPTFRKYLIRTHATQPV